MGCTVESTVFSMGPYCRNSYQPQFPGSKRPVISRCKVRWSPNVKDEDWRLPKMRRPGHWRNCRIHLTRVGMYSCNMRDSKLNFNSLIHFWTCLSKKQVDTNHWYRLIYLVSSCFIHSTWWRIFWYLKTVYESRVERACCFSMPSGSCSVRISSLGEASDHCRLGMGLQWFQIAMWKPTLTWYFQILKVTCQICYDIGGSCLQYLLYSVGVCGFLMLILSRVSIPGLVHTCSWGQVNDPAVPDFIEAGQLVGVLWWGRFMTLVYILFRKKTLIKWLLSCILDAHSASVQS